MIRRELAEVAPRQVAATEEEEAIEVAVHLVIGQGGS